MANECASDVTM